MKYKISTLFLLLFFLNTKSYSQYEGPNNPAAVQNSSNGCLACPGGEWSNPLSVQYSDMKYSDVTLMQYPNCFMSTCYYSRYLFVTDFGFSIPSDAVIKGVKVDILRKSDASYGVSDTITRLITTNPPSGDNKALPGNWPINPLTATYGGENDTWGLDFTTDSINSPSFGLAIMVANRSAVGKSVMASIDNVQITVYYNIAIGIQLQTREASLVNVSYIPTEHALKIAGFGEQSINSLSVVNLLGRIIYSSPPIHLLNEVRKIALPEMAKGIYFAVYNENGKPVTKKFFVE